MIVYQKLKVLLIFKIMLLIPTIPIPTLLCILFLNLFLVHSFEDYVMYHSYYNQLFADQANIYSTAGIHLAWLDNCPPRHRGHYDCKTRLKYDSIRSKNTPGMWRHLLSLRSNENSVGGCYQMNYHHYKAARIQDEQTS